MAKEDYLEGYGQGLKRGAEGPIMGRINKVLDKALGNPNESAKRGLDQGFDEMKAAKKAESNKTKIINKPSSEVQKFDENYKKGGKVSSASKRADGCATKGKTKGRII
jgi:polyribonucleotide nucleotidyltransferase